MKATRDWFLEAGYGVLTVAVLVLCGVTLCTTHPFSLCKERDIRLLGIVLQGLGFWIVAMGLKDLGFHFGTPSLPALIRGHWARRPFFRRNEAVIASGASVFALTGIGRGRARSIPGPNTPTEERLSLLEQEVTTLYGEVDRLDRERETLEADFKKGLAEEAAVRAKDIADVKRTIEKTLADGVALEWIGLAYFVVGMILGGIAPELATLFGHPSSCNGPPMLTL